MNRPVLAAGVVVALLAAACSGDDDTADSTVPATTESVATSAATDPPDTTPPPTDPPTTTTSTTIPPSTTIDVEALKAQIAEDYEQSAELLDELASNPTLEGLDETLARISEPGSADYNEIREFIEALVDRGERVVDGEPDYSTVEVEAVELEGSLPYEAAIVTFCYVSNRARVDGRGAVQPGTGDLVAARRSQPVVLTDHGWVATDVATQLWGGLEVTECPPA